LTHLGQQQEHSRQLYGKQRVCLGSDIRGVQLIIITQITFINEWRLFKLRKTLVQGNCLVFRQLIKRLSLRMKGGRSNERKPPPATHNADPQRRRIWHNNFIYRT
jgi:hypothetical protein